MEFTTGSKGVGDSRLTALYSLPAFGRQRFHVNLGLSFPTGDIDQRGDTPHGLDRKLLYPMQLGFGAFDLLPGLTYLGQSDRWSWGGQSIATLRLGENSNAYTLGNRFMVTGWGGRQWLDWLSTSVRLDAYLWGNIDGADPKLAHALRMRMVPTADPARRGGERVDAGFGVNVDIRRGALKGHHIAVEGRVPLYQSLDGPQLETDWVLTVGWQYAFAGRTTIRAFPHQAVGRISEA